MRKILTAIVALVSLMSMVPLVAPDTKNVTASVTVSTLCDIAASPETISFGTPIPGQSGTQDSVTISMPNGNTPTTPTISGSGWTGTGTTPPIMSVGATNWYVGTGTPASLTGSGVSIGHAVSYGTENNAVVNLNVAIPNGQAADTYTQTVTFTASC